MNNLSTHFLKCRYFYYETCNSQYRLTNKFFFANFLQKVTKYYMLQIFLIPNKQLEKIKFPAIFILTFFCIIYKQIAQTGDKQYISSIPYQKNGIKIAISILFSKIDSVVSFPTYYKCKDINYNCQYLLVIMDQESNSHFQQELDQEYYAYKPQTGSKETPDGYEDFGKTPKKSIKTQSLQKKQSLYHEQQDKNFSPIITEEDQQPTQKIHIKRQSFENFNEQTVKKPRKQRERDSTKTPLQFDKTQRQEQSQSQFQSEEYKRPHYLLCPQLVKEQMDITVPKINDNGQTLQTVTHTVYFPYKRYDLQQKYIKQLITGLQNKLNCLLESPTGTGKTQMMLNGVMSWLQSDYKKRSKQYTLDVPKRKILYLSRTQKQLEQVQNELSKTCFRPTMAILGSRDNLCNNKELKYLQGQDKNQECKQRLKINQKIKRMKEQGKKIPANLQHRGCKYHRQPAQTIKIFNTNNFSKQIIDLQDIKKNGQKQCFCTYFYPYHIKEQADIFFMPYPYLLNVGLQKKYIQFVSNSIVIIDEGHNIAQQACSGINKTFSNSLLHQLITQISSLEQLAEKQQYPYINLSLIKKNSKKWLEIMDKIFQHTNFCENVSQQEDNSKERQKYKIVPEEQTLRYLYGIFVGTVPEHDEKTINFLKTGQESEGTQQIIKQVSQYFQKLQRQIISTIEITNNIVGAKHRYLERLFYILKQARFLIENKKQRMHYRIFLKKKDKTFKFELVCLNPSLTMSRLEKMNPRNIIVTSGTLCPLQVWQRQLKTSFPRKISNQHIIKPQQLKLMILNYGKKGTWLQFTKQKSNQKLLIDMTHSIVDLIQKIPNGVLVVFPSKKYLKKFEDKLRSQNLYFRLNQRKSIFSQTKSHANDYLEQYTQKAKQKGAVLFCYCRGKITQGMDFSNQLCRGVIIVGVPFPNSTDPYISQKKDYLTKLSKLNKQQHKSITGQQWYNIGAMRVVSQALGRVIRNKEDFGTVYLLDSRYITWKLKRYFPQWIQKSIVEKGISFYEAIKETQQFFNKFMPKNPELPTSSENRLTVRKTYNTFVAMNKEKKL